jgi:GNAT superfamily N-acetyltransferase
MQKPVKTLRVDGQEIAFRQLEPEEREAYVALHRTCFPRMTNNAAQVGWWLFDSEFRNRNYVLAAGDRLLGALSFLSLGVKLGDSIKSGAVVSNVMVDPEYRGRGLFLSINRLCLEWESEVCGTEVVVGRTDVVKGYLKVGWTSPTQLVYFARRPERGAAFPPGVKAIERFDEGFAPLCERFYRGIGFGLIKTPAFLNFRIFQKPGVSYGVYAAWSAEGKPAGYIVLKKFHEAERGIDKCHVVDLVAPDLVTFASLLDCAESLYRDCQEINILQPEASLYQPWLLERGFRRGSQYNPEENLIFFAAQNSTVVFPEGRRHYVIADDESW